MASRNPGQDLDQAQMRRNEFLNQPSDIHHQGQATNFFEETGTQAKNMAQNAMDVAKGAAVGAVNMAQGAADAVKNTLGMNSPDATTGIAMDQPGSTTNMGGATYPTPSNTNSSNNPSTRM